MELKYLKQMLNIFLGLFLEVQFLTNRLQVSDSDFELIQIGFVTIQIGFDMIQIEANITSFS